MTATARASLQQILLHEFDGQNPLQQILFGALLAMALAHQVAFQSARSSLNPDRIVQVSAARALLDGRGYSLDVCYPRNVRASYEVKFPIGYSLLMAGLMHIFGGEVWWTGLALELAGLILTLVAWALILQYLGPAIGWPAALGVIGIWSVVHLLRSLYGTDLLALGLFSAAVAIFLRFVTESRSPVLGAAAVGLLVAAACCMRQAYAVLIPVFPLTIASLYGFAHRRVVFASVVAVAIPAIALAAEGLLRESLTPSDAFNSSTLTDTLNSPLTDESIRWSHLGRMNAFFSNMFGAEPLVAAVVRKLGGDEIVLSVVLLTIGLIVLLLISRGLRFRASYPFAALALPWQTERTRAFVLLGIWTTLLTIMTLVGLSLLEPMQTWTPEGWTYVEELRYYSPVFGFLIVAFVLGLSRAWNSKRFRKANRAACAGLLLLFLSAAIYDLHVTALNPAAPPPGRIAAIGEIVRSEMARGRTVIASNSCPEPDYAEIASMYGACPFEGKARSLPNLPSPEAVTVLAVLPADQPDSASSLSAHFTAETAVAEFEQCRVHLVAVR